MRTKKTPTGGLSQSEQMGKRMEVARVVASMSQKQLAEALAKLAPDGKFSQSAVSRIESGDQEASASQVSLIARVLKVTEQHLLTGKEAGRTAPVADGSDHEAVSDPASGTLAFHVPLAHDSFMRYMDCP